MCDRVLVCLVIPHFDHLEQFRNFLPELLGSSLPLVVVDDASPQQSFDALARLLEEQAPGSSLCRHTRNLGKGGAVMTGLKMAQEAGFTHAIQIDADGQHDLTGIVQLVEEATRYPHAIICGQPVFNETVSRLRFYSRYITLYLVWLETLSTEVRDAMCGFRLYPLQPTMTLVSAGIGGNRMAFDPEILVRAAWTGIPLRYVPVKVEYPKDGKSHFRYLRDNLEISWMHTRLIFGMLMRLPLLIRRNRSRRGVRPGQ